MSLHPDIAAVLAGDSEGCIITGDCLAIMADVPTIWPEANIAYGAVTAMVTDPPYGIGLASHGQITMTRQPVIGDANQGIGIMALSWAAGKGLPTVAFASPQKSWPGDWRQWLVWDKGGAVGGGGDRATCWKFSWELIQVARTGTLAGMRDEAVLRFPIGPSSLHWHPNQKPESLMRYLVSKISRRADTILDPFCGSGTTCVAAKKLGRRWIGIEIDPKYADIARNRIKSTPRPLFTPESDSHPKGHGPDLFAELKS